ncbi:MAG: class I SAM-dependent methyltransferase [Bryobacterales bacterium]|nr:class I SAM-dependent methyltransferase [Bryobacterales bacterium]
MLGSDSTGSATPAQPRQRPAGGPQPVRVESRPKVQPVTRQSPGLEQFFGTMRERRGLAIIDLAGLSQANVSFITNLGHTIYSDDLLQSLDEALAHGGADPRMGTRFLEQSLPFREPGFDGALLWDCLQFLPPAWLEAGVERLHSILRPGAAVLAFFNADEKAAAVPSYQYRIADQRTLHLTPRGTRAPAPYFNNRVLERLFHRFATTKFFLTRDHLREVLVKR